jgi:serine protease Do
MSIPGLGEVAERVRRFTVLVEPGGRGSGSGVIWNSDGLVVTNAHVARGSLVEIGLWDGRKFSADVVSRDARRDLASLRILAAGLTAASVLDSSEIRPGQVAIAIGNPWGFLGAMTLGVVHSVGPVEALGARRWVQADVRLAPGNSGGPLVDAQGRVMGINTMVAGRLALAIPSNEVARFLGGATGGHWLGVALSPVRLPRSRGSRVGLLVLEIEPGSPAAMASLLPGDILLGTEESTFSSVEDLREALAGQQPRILRLRFLRGDYDKTRRVSIALPGGGRSSIAA